MEFDAAVAELDTLVQTLEREGDERALALLELIDAIHRPALERLAAGDLDHPVAQAVLAMYNVAGVDDSVQVEAALDEVRPYIHSHGGEVELLEVVDGAVHVRLSGSCRGCAGSAMTLKRGIESVLREHYPAFREVVAHDEEGAPLPEGDEATSPPAKGVPLPMAGEEPSPPAPRVVQLQQLKRPVFVEAAAVDDLPPGELRAATVDDIPVLLVNVEGEVYAFKNVCAVDGMPLDGGRLAGTVLVCPWLNCAYDARSGKRVDDPAEPGLAVVPIALREGAVQVAVNVA